MVNSQLTAYNTLNQNTEGFVPVPLFEYSIQELELQSRPLEEQKLVSYYPTGSSAFQYIISTSDLDQPWDQLIFNYKYEDVPAFA